MYLIPMTLSGAKKMRKELEYLKNICRPKIIKSISISRSYGDLKENSEYHSAKEQQSFCESRIKEIETKLSYAQIIDISKFNKINKIIFGATVIIKNINNKKKKKYQIVGDDESDSKKNLISINSPIARSLIGKNKGDLVVIKTNNMKYNFKIIEVKYI